MIRRFLETLTGEELDRVLTTKMRPGSYDLAQNYTGAQIGPCLIGTAFGAAGEHGIHDNSKCTFCQKVASRGREIEVQYDNLCKRFTAKRINTLIRDQALRVQLSRIPKAIPTEGALV